MARTHQLPARRNQLLLEAVPSYKDLVSRRRLGQTHLTAKGVSTDANSVDTFYYAHLRVNLPKGIKSGIFKSSAPPTYFLMQRCTDGYISATGMFKAVFPYASLDEEAAEREYIRSLPETSAEETAGNTWISPEGALTLAEEYSIKPWILALLDPSDIVPSGPSDAGAPAELRSPPKFNLSQPSLEPPTPGPRRSRRSASPSKSAVMSKRAVATPRKRRTAGSSQSGESQLSNASTLVNGESPARIPVVAKIKAVDAKVKVENVEEVDESTEDLKIKFQVQKDVKFEGDDEEVKRTTVDMEVPLFAPMPSADDAANLIEKAKAMVKEQQEALEKEKAEKDEVKDEESAEPSLDAEASSVADTAAGKRKVDESDMKSEEETTAGPSAKRTKTVVEERKTKMRKRAFYGIGATIAVGALGAVAPLVLPFIQNAL